MNFILGGAANTYVGKHFGKVIWSELYSDMDHEYYRNEATKNDQNIYLKTDYSDCSTHLHLRGWPQLYYYN